MYLRQQDPITSAREQNSKKIEKAIQASLSAWGVEGVSVSFSANTSLFNRDSQINVSGRTIACKRSRRFSLRTREGSVQVCVSVLPGQEYSGRNKQSHLFLCGLGPALPSRNYRILFSAFPGSGCCTRRLIHCVRGFVNGPFRAVALTRPIANPF